MRQQLTNILYKFTKPQLLQNLNELATHQWKSRDELQALQLSHLYQLLEYVKIHVPYYRDLFQQIGFDPRDFLKDPNTFQQIPPLTKALIRQHKEQLLTTEAARLKTLGWVKTGGTTGEPLWFGQDQAYRNWNYAHDFHVMTWSGWQLSDPQFWLWGHVPDTAPTGFTLKLGQAKSWFLNRFDSNAFIMSDDSLAQLARQIAAHPQGVLWSYVSTAHRFAQFLQQFPEWQQERPSPLKAIFTAAEPLFESQRQLIEGVLGAPIFNCYSSAPIFNCYSSIDTGDIACECPEHNGLHMTTRNTYTEVLRGNQPVAVGEEGEFVITNLVNYAMPMIRYKIEDWGRKSDRHCACGRGLPMLEVVEGRKIDLFKTRDGRTVYGAFAKDLMPRMANVKQFQVIQKSLDLVIFRIVAEGELEADKLRYVEQVTKGALGEQVEVRFEFVDSLPATPTGKHRYLVSEI